MDLVEAEDSNSAFVCVSVGFVCRFSGFWFPKGIRHTVGAAPSTVGSILFP